MVERYLVFRILRSDRPSVMGLAGLMLCINTQTIQNVPAGGDNYSIIKALQGILFIASYLSTRHNRPGTGYFPAFQATSPEYPAIPLLPRKIALVSWYFPPFQAKSPWYIVNMLVTKENRPGKLVLTGFSGENHALINGIGERSLAKLPRIPMASQRLLDEVRAVM